MSATAAINIDGVENALLIPSDALTQTSSSSYVYTSYNEETGELSDMVEVAAGLNNGKFVEIISGLSDGDIVYYFEAEEGFSFFDGNMPGGVNIPGSDNMPGGDSMPGMPSGDRSSSGDRDRGNYQGNMQPGN